MKASLLSASGAGYRPESRDSTNRGSGLIGIALLAPIPFYWFQRCRPRHLNPLQCGALAGVIAVLIHNTAKFNMQTPGTAVAFWTALGILFGPNVGGEPSRRPRPNHQSQTPNPDPRTLGGGPP